MALRTAWMLTVGLCKDVTRLGLGGPSPPKDVAAPSNWNSNRSFLHGCFVNSM